MAVTSPIDVTTPATNRRRQLAIQLQTQYANNRGGQRQMHALNSQALHAMPLFGGGGARDSANLPPAPMPQLTVPFMQSPGLAKALGISNPASPYAPTVSPGPGQASAGFPDPASVGPPAVTQSADPNAVQPGAGQYASGEQANQPLVDPTQAFANFGLDAGNTPAAGVRRLYPSGQQQTNPVTSPGRPLMGQTYYI